MDTSKLRNFMLKTTIEVGALTRPLFGKCKKVEVKSHILDLVSEADKAANKLFVQRINKAFPTHGIISEEMPAEGIDKEFVWIIDPIDGTLNYIKGLPAYAIIVALQIKGAVELSCVYNPISGEYYMAERWKGAFLNGERIKCSPQSTIIDSVGLTNDSMSDQRLNFLNDLHVHVQNHERPTRKIVWASSVGSTGISCGYIADARKDWYYCSGGGGIWDYAGTVLLLQESGCLVTNPDGTEWKHGTGPFIAANPRLHTELVRVFQSHNIQQA